MTTITAHRINISQNSVPEIADLNRAVMSHCTASLAYLLIEQMKDHELLTVDGERKENRIIDLKFS